MSGPSPRFAGVACGVGSGALWGLVFLAPKLVPDASPLLMAVGRYLAYGLLALMLVAPRWRRVTAALDRRAWLGLIWLSLVGNLVYFVLVVLGVHLAGVAATALIVGMVPVAVTLWGLRDPDAAPLARLVAPLSLAVLSVVLIGYEALGREGMGGDPRAILLGLGCALGALACWSAFAVDNSRWLDRLPSVTAHDWSLLLGVATGALSLLLLPAAALVPGTGFGVDDLWSFAAVSAAVAFGASILGNALWNRASQLLPLTLLGQMIVFETLFAFLYGFVFEQRWPTVLELIAVALMIVGVVWCVRAHAPVREPLAEADR